MKKDKGRKTELATPYQRIVVKLGTNLLTGGSDHLNQDVMTSLVAQMAQLHQKGLELLVVSSGAEQAHGAESASVPVQQLARTTTAQLNSKPKVLEVGWIANQHQARHAGFQHDRVIAAELQYHAFPGPRHVGDRTANGSAPESRCRGADRHRSLLTPDPLHVIDAAAFHGRHAAPHRFHFGQFGHGSPGTSKGNGAGGAADCGTP